MHKPSPNHPFRYKNQAKHPPLYTPIWFDYVWADMYLDSHTEERTEWNPCIEQIDGMEQLDPYTVAHEFVGQFDV
jgi:hypothetical protein